MTRPQSSTLFAILGLALAFDLAGSATAPWPPVAHLLSPLPRQTSSPTAPDPMSKPAMTARQLARILSQDDPARIVVIAVTDAKGRVQHLPIHSVSTTAYDVKRREVGLDELTPQAVRLGFTEADVLERSKPAVLLSP